MIRSALRYSVIAFVFFQSAPSWAQTIQDLGEELNTLVAEASELNKGMAQSTEENMRLHKEYDLYINDQKQKNEWVKTDVQKQIDTVKKPMENEYQSHLKTYSSQCDPAIVGKVGQAQFQRCEEWKTVLDAEKADKDSLWKRYAEDYNAKVILPIKQAIERQKVRMAEIDRKMKANFKIFTAKQDRFLAIQSRVKEIENKVRTLCTPGAKPQGGENFTSAERDKWCTDIDWDGASKRLPPIYKYQGTGGVFSNGALN